MSGKVTENAFIKLVEECIQLRDVAQKVLSAPLGDDNLTRLEALVLLSLTEARRPQTVPQIGRNIGHGRQVVLRAVKRLESLDLVTRQPNPDHKTAPLVIPTGNGRAVEIAMADRLVETIGKAMTAEDMASCSRLAEEIGRLRRIVEGIDA